MKNETVLVLRTCNHDMTSTKGFKWPDKGKVSAPDWNPTAECGYGLHGFLWGEGDGEFANWSPDAKWLVVKVKKESIIDLRGKVKFSSGNVVFCGSREDATSYIIQHGARGKAVIGSTAVAGYSGTATAGFGGVIAIKYYNEKRYKIAVAYVKDVDGDGDLEPNTKYRIDENHQFVKVSE